MRAEAAVPGTGRFRLHPPVNSGALSDDSVLLFIGGLETVDTCNVQVLPLSERLVRQPGHRC